MLGADAAGVGNDITQGKYEEALPSFSRAPGDFLSEYEDFDAADGAAFARPCSLMACIPERKENGAAESVATTPG